MSKRHNLKLGHRVARSKASCTEWTLSQAQKAREARRKAKYDAAGADPDVARAREARMTRPLVATRELADAKAAFEAQQAMMHKNRGRGRRSRGGHQGFTIPTRKDRERPKLTDQKVILAKIDDESILIRSRGIGLAVNQLTTR